MFRAICDNFTRSTGTENFIPIDTVIHANSIDLLQVVVQKREGHWSWHKHVHTPYDFKIKNLLINYKKKMKIKKKTSNFCSWSREIELSLGGKFGRAILEDLGDKNLSSKDKVRIEANIGETEMDKLNPNTIYRKLLGRKINLEHPWVQQVCQDKKNVICVVQSIVKLAGDAEIKTTSIKKKSGEEETSDKSKDLGLVSGTPIAYKVMALQVGVHSGVVVPCMGVGVKGGFLEDSKILGVPADGTADDSYESDIEDEDEPNPPQEPVPEPEPETTAGPVEEVAQPNEAGGTGNDAIGAPEEIVGVLQPLLDLPETERLSFTSVLNSLLPEDIEILDKIFLEAKSCTGGEHVINTGGRAFMDRDSCLVLLKLAGFTEKSDIEVTVSDPSSAMFKACGHVIGAMTYLSMELLELVRACLPEIASGLLLLCGKALKGEKSVTLDNAQTLVESNVGGDILQRMNIQAGSDSASIPEVVPEVLDKVFWVLFAIQGTSEVAALW